MPAYPYECEKCGDAFEVRRGMTDESAVVCTACGSRRVRRVYMALAMVGAGSGSSPSGGMDEVPMGGSCCGAGGCGCG